MSVRTIFNIVLKIMGLLFLKEIIGSIPQFLSTVSMLFTGDKLNSTNYLFIFCIILVNAALYIIPIVYLIFKTEYLIDILKLDVGLVDDKVEMNMHRSTVLSIVVMTVGGFIFVQEVPVLFYKTYEYFFYQRLSYLKDTSPTYVYLSIAKVVISLFLMIGQRQIVNLIEKQRKK